jgi:hypothetical protein
VDLKRQRDRLAIIIFDADTRAGKAYDVALLVVIAASVLVAMPTAKSTSPSPSKSPLVTDQSPYRENPLDNCPSGTRRI